MAICARCNRTRDKSVPILMRCNCDIKDSIKRRWGLESTIMIGGVEVTIPKGGFHIKNGKIKSNRSRNRASRDRKRALISMKIKELHTARKDYHKPSELEELDALILNLQQELDEL